MNEGALEFDGNSNDSFWSILIIIRLSMCVFIHITGRFVKYVLALGDNNYMKIDGLYRAVLIILR